MGISIDSYIFVIEWLMCFVNRRCSASLGKNAGMQDNMTIKPGISATIKQIPRKISAATKEPQARNPITFIFSRANTLIMDTSRVSQFLSSLGSAGFFQRLFGWKKILNEARSAQETLASLQGDFSTAEKKVQETHDAFTIAQTNYNNERQKYAALKTEYDGRLAELAEAKKRIAQEESIKAEQDARYQRNVTELNTLIAEQRAARKELEDQKQQLQDEHNNLLATAWQRHERAVEEHMHELAAKYDFALCDKSSYPYEGIPDNAFYIGERYTIFDAKSPKNPEDLEHFPTYLKQQAEKMGKYCRNENVRKDAFLVVPSSTLDVLDTFMYPMADYTVYVITPEAVLPILQMLKRIESYDFAEQLSPEDRSSICQLIGRLSHTAKRKIQIDTYLSREMLGVLQDIGSLPEEIEVEVNKYEKEAKLNPPLEKRAKVIAISSIGDDVDKIYNDTIGWSITEH